MKMLKEERQGRSEIREVVWKEECNEVSLYTEIELTFDFTRWYDLSSTKEKQSTTMSFFANPISVSC